MDYLTWILLGVVIFYAGMMFVKTALPLVRYKKTKGAVIEVKGKIISSYGEDVIKKKGTAIKSFYPVFQSEVEGKKLKLSGLVRYAGEFKDFNEKEVDLYLDKETNELWCKNDLPMMKKLLINRILIILFLIVLLIVTSFLP